MRVRRQLVTNLSAVSVGIGAAQAFGLLRTLIVIRLLSTEDYGIGALLLATGGALELLSDLSLNKQVVQSRDANEPDFLGSLHAVNAIRGCLVGLMLLLAAGPLSGFVKASDAVQSFRWLAALPVLTGLQHLEVFRQQRDGKFAPSMIVVGVPNLITALAAYPVTRSLGDYRAVLCLMLLNSCIATILSHALARCRYVWSWNSDYWNQAIAFGAPLLMNGLLIFAGQQADKLLIGRYYSHTMLSIYSAAYLLTMRPATAVAQVLGTVALPALSRKSHSGDLQDSVSRYLSFYLLVAGFLSASLLLLVEVIVIPLLGVKYSSCIEYLPWFSILSSAFIVKAGLMALLLSRGDTTGSLLCNLPRLVNIPLIYLVASQGKPMPYVILSLMLAESVVIALSLVRATRQLSFDWKPVCIGAAVAAVMWAMAFFTWQRNSSSGVHFSVTAIVAMLFFLAARALTRKPRRDVPAGARF